MKTKYVILTFLVAFAAGFLIGRATVGTKEIVKWKQGETVVRAVPVPEVKRTTIPKLYFLPVKADTIFIDSVMTIVQKVDTAKIIEEYVSINHYDFTLFDEEYGKLDLRQDLQYNRIAKVDYSFTPRYKEVTKVRKQLFTPFASGSYSTLNVLGIGGGVFINDLGFEYQYQHNYRTNQSGHMFGAKVKF